MVKDYKGRLLIEVGRVRRAFGIKGELTVDWFDGSSPVGANGGKIFLDTDGKIAEFAIIKDKPHGNCSIISLKSVKSRNDAEGLRGSAIMIGKEDLPALQEGEYYTYELIDIRVETTEGEYLGDLKEIFSTGGNDVYVVKKDGRELLIPATDEVVKRVDKEKRIMVVQLIDGLLQ